MKLLRRALGQGLAFGLSAAILEFVFNFLPFAQRRMGPGPWFLAETAALEIGLGALLGLVAAPALALRGGPFFHLALVAALWYALERWVPLDSPIFALLGVARPVGGLALVLLGMLVATRFPRLPWLAGAVLLALAGAAPYAYLGATTPPQPEPPALSEPPPGAPDVVVVVLDTVRARSVSTYGYERATAPELDTLAAEGALFLDATSPSTWSLPSHASLFTGRYPSSHGAHAEHVFLDARFPTLAQVLASVGYETFCITANPWISDGLGLTRGFAWQDQAVRSHGGAGLGFSFIHRLLDRLGLQESDKGGALVAASFERWASERPADAGRPAFVFLNFLEAHFPYHQLPHDYLWQWSDRPYSELRRLGLDLTAQEFGGPAVPVERAAVPARDMYDGGVAYSTALLQRVVDALRARGTLDETVLVVLSDHGELLGEKEGYFGHGPSFYQPMVEVPLYLRFPPRVPAGVRVATPVSTVGVFATVLDLANLGPPPTLQVGSLVPLLEDPRAGTGPILAELHDGDSMGTEVERADPQMQGDRRYRLLREGDLKLVTSSKGDALLYDLAVDPEETRDLAAERPADLARMQARLAEVAAALELPALDAPLAVGEDAPELDDATRERLRALGYAE